MIWVVLACKFCGCPIPGHDGFARYPDRTVAHFECGSWEVFQRAVNRPAFPIEPGMPLPPEWSMPSAIHRAPCLRS